MHSLYNDVISTGQTLSAPIDEYENVSDAFASMQLYPRCSLTTISIGATMTSHLYRPPRVTAVAKCDVLVPLY